MQRCNMAQYKRSCHQVPLIKTREAFAAKRMQWITLGKPKGTIQKSKFDKDCEKIKELLKLVGNTKPYSAQHLH